MTETREAVLCDRWADISGETLRWKTGDDCHGRRCSHTPPCRCAGCLSSSCISGGIRFYIKFSGQIISRAATTDSRVDSSANAERDDQYSFSAVAPRRRRLPTESRQLFDVRKTWNNLLAGGSMDLEAVQQISEGSGTGNKRQDSTEKVRDQPQLYVLLTGRRTRRTRRKRK